MTANTELIIKKGRKWQREVRAGEGYTRKTQPRGEAAERMARRGALLTHGPVHGNVHTDQCVEGYMSKD